MTQPSIAREVARIVGTGNTLQRSGVLVEPGRTLVVRVSSHLSGGAIAPASVKFNSTDMDVGGVSTPGGGTHGGNHFAGFYSFRNGTGSNITAAIDVAFPSSPLNTKSEFDGTVYIGVDTTPFQDFKTANTNNGSSSSPTTAARSHDTRIDDWVLDILPYSYGASGSSTPFSGQTKISEDATVNEYTGTSYKPAVGNTTSIGWNKTYDFGDPYSSIVLRTAAPVTTTIGSVNVTQVQGTGVQVGQTAQVKATALSTTGQPVAGASVTFSGLNSTNATPGSATGTTDANGEVIITLTGVLPGSLSIGASATLSSTTVTDASPLSFPVNAGIGGVSAMAVAVSAPSGPTISVQPVGRVVNQGASAAFTIQAAASAGSLSYQVQERQGLTWVDLAGSTSALFLVGVAQLTDHNRRFRWRLSDSNGQTLSDEFVLRVAGQVASLLLAPASKSQARSTRAIFTLTATDQAGTPVPNLTGLQARVSPAGAGTPAVINPTDEAGQTLVNVDCGAAAGNATVWVVKSN